MNEIDKLYKFLDEFFEKKDKDKDSYFRDYLELIIDDEHIKISMDSNLQMNAASLDKSNGVMSIQTLGTLQEYVKKYFDNRFTMDDLYSQYFS